jgi:magnesium chelatase family protein
MFSRTIGFSHYETNRSLRVGSNEIEVSSACGSPSINVLGVDKDCVERAKCAIRETGKVVTGFSTTINMRDVHGTTATDGLDLAVAMGLLSATGEISLDATKYVFYGNLSLDGRLNCPSYFDRVIYSDIVNETCEGNTLIIPTGCETPRGMPRGIEYVEVPTLAECIKVCCG